MAKDDLTLRMFFVSDSGAAVCLSEVADPTLPKALHWVPRSLIGYSRKTRDDQKPAFFPEYVFTLPEWKVDASDLWKFVTD
jgi:hypothetical protein